MDWRHVAMSCCYRAWDYKFPQDFADSLDNLSPISKIIGERFFLFLAIFQVSAAVAASFLQHSNVYCTTFCSLYKPRYAQLSLPSFHISTKKKKMPVKRNGMQRNSWKSMMIVAASLFWPKCFLTTAHSCTTVTAISYPAETPRLTVNQKTQNGTHSWPFPGGLLMLLSQHN